MDDRVSDANVFGKNRDSLLDGDIAVGFMAGVLILPQTKGLLQSEHFPVAGTLIEEARLGHMGHIVTENRHGLIVDGGLTEANGTAECATALDMIEERRGRRLALGADRNHDFVAGCRARGYVPHVAQNDAGRRWAVDRRTTRHPGYAMVPMQ